MKNCPHCGKILHPDKGKARANIKANLKALPALFKKHEKKDICNTCPYKRLMNNQSTWAVLMKHAPELLSDDIKQRINKYE